MKNLTWSKLKEMIDNGFAFQYETLDSNRYYIYLFVDGEEFSHVMLFTDTANKTEFDNNYASLASADAMDLLGSQNAHVFISEALVDGVYEDGKLVTCHHAFKTFNVENKHATGGLAFKVWGSPNKTDWELVVDETTLAALSKVSVTNNDYWKFVKMSAKGNGSASTIDAFLQVGE